MDAKGLKEKLNKHIITMSYLVIGNV